MPTATLLDLTHLRLFTDGDEEIEKSMLSEIVKELKSETVKLKDMLAAEDWHSFSRATHKLKTTLPFIGNQQLVELNKQMEQASRTLINLEQIPAWSEEFFAVLPAVIAELETHVQA